MSPSHTLYLQNVFYFQFYFQCTIFDSLHCIQLTLIIAILQVSTTTVLQLNVVSCTVF